MKNLFLLGLVGFVGGTLLHQYTPAIARDQFKKAFVAKYVDGNENSEFVALFKKVNCNVCHIGPNPNAGNKNRNEYGKAYNKLVTTKDIANKAKMEEALDEIAKLPSDPNNPNSPTYGDLLKQGKLPCENPPAGQAAAAPAAAGGN